MDDGLAAAAAAVAPDSSDDEARGPLASGDDEQGRWHDHMHRALIESLQPPRSQHPSWWGKRFHGLQVGHGAWLAGGAWTGRHPSEG